MTNEIKAGSKLTDEEVIELILSKFHGHTRKQWDEDLSKRYPWIELPYLVRGVWNTAQGRDWFDNGYKSLKPKS